MGDVFASGQHDRHRYGRTVLEKREARSENEAGDFHRLSQWDANAAVWAGHCDDIPAAADASTLDELLDKITAMALDLLPDNHPDVDPANLFIQVMNARNSASG